MSRQKGINFDVANITLEIITFAEEKNVGHYIHQILRSSSFYGLMFYVSKNEVNIYGPYL